MKATDVMKRAYHIATLSLRKCYAQEGIFAGRKHFDDYWARDSFFASLGAIQLKDYEIVKKNLELFLKHTRKDGQVPLRIGEYNILAKFFRESFGLREKNKTLKPRYFNDRNKNFPIDVNSLLLVAAYYYIKNSGDKEFANNYYDKLKKVLKRNLDLDKDHDFLLKNMAASSWDDSLKITGESIYTNVCNCAALRSFWKISSVLKKKNSEKYKKMYLKAKNKINEKFWNGKYYDNFILGKKRIDIFSTAGNLLAIHLHVADKEKAFFIENKIEQSEINKFVPSLTNYPKYPSKFVYFPFYFTGTYDYHNMGMCWLWLGCEDVIVKYKLGMKQKAFDLLEKISTTIVKHNGVYEVYEKNGFPVDRFFYRSEVPFAWSASLFILAYHTLFKRKNVITWNLK
jgi:glycogen debranching enzyme